MTPRDLRIAEAVRDACVAEFQTRADGARAMVAAGTVMSTGAARVTETIRQLEANAALLRTLDVAAVVATVPTAPDPRARMREHLRERMDSMLECPPMWGGNLEVELQMLGALEMLHVVERPDDTRPRVILDSWIAFINRRFETSLPLAEILKRKGREAEFTALMGEFRAYVEERLSRPAATVPAARDAYLDSVARAVMFVDEWVTADRVRACAAEAAASLGRPLTMRDARAVIDVVLVELAAVAREEFPAGDMARRSIADRVVALFSASLKA